MKPGQASKTAVMVCMARAAAHERMGDVPFSDPVAIALLPDEARVQVERIRAQQRPAGLGARMRQEFGAARAKMMVTRTISIDAAIRAHPTPQLVILGAGLDGRAFRMPELHDAVVFEVDHPDSQREKRARAAALTPTARELRFVPLDFAQGGLAEALIAGGFDASKPTTWVWEGVVMYLTQAEIEATLAEIARLSAPASRLIIAYFSPALILALVGAVLWRVGEPIKSVHTVEAMHALLARFGFQSKEDRSISELGAALSPAFAKATRRMKHLRMVTADKRG